MQLSTEIYFLSIAKCNFENNDMHMFYGKWAKGVCIWESGGSDVGFGDVCSNCGNLGFIS